MEMDEMRRKGLVLLGCGHMGSAMLRRWLDGTLAPGEVWVVDPNPSDWLQGVEGLNLNAELPETPGAVLIAVKPQTMEEALPGMSAMGGGGTLFVSVAAGVPIARYEKLLGDGTPIVRAMPNIPASIGRGITGLVANDAGAPSLPLARTLLDAVGQTVVVDEEDQMDAVTGLSGSGPGFVFHMIECLAKAGEAEGLPADVAMALARATVSGSGQLAEESDRAPSDLRLDVMSEGGTTSAGLEVLMGELPDLIARTVAAAAARSRELRA